MIELTTRQQAAIDKHLPGKLADLGLESPADISLTDFSVRELRGMERGVYGLMRDCRNLAEHPKNANDKAGAEIEAAFDALTDISDCIEDARVASTDGDPRRPRGEDGEARSDEYPAEPDEPAMGLRAEQRFADHATRGGEQYSGLGLGKYLRAMVLGGKTDLEKRALSEGSDSAGGYTVPEVLANRLVDLMRANNQAINAGAVTMPLTSDKNTIAKVASDPAPGWRAENASITESDPTFANVVMEPKSLAVLVRVSREVLDDSVNIGTALPGIMAAAMAQELDRVVFLGSGSSNEPSGLDNTSGVLELAHDAAISSYAPLVTARKDVLANNAANASVWVMHPDTEAAFGGLVDSTGQPLNYPSILDRPEPMRMLTTTKLPVDGGTGSNETTVYGGDFGQVVIGLRNDVRVEILRERYADNMQYGFLAHLRADVAVIRPDQLIRITGVQLS